MMLQLTTLEPRPGETVWTATGVSGMTGIEWRFAVDHRVGENLADMLDEGEIDLTVHVEPWQLMGKVTR